MNAPLTITARRVPWPDLRAQSERKSLRLKWDALGPAGEVLVARSTHPFTDGAFALLQRGAPPDALVRTRHHGSDTDVFVPMPLGRLAAEGAKRAAARAKIAARLRGVCERMAKSAPEAITLPAEKVGGEEGGFPGPCAGNAT